MYVGELFVTVNEIFRFLSLPYLSVLDKCLDSPLYLLFFFLCCISTEKRQSDNYLNNTTICQRHLGIVIFLFNEVGVISGNFYI